jgi:hypothetical protein
MIINAGATDQYAVTNSDVNIVTNANADPYPDAVTNGFMYCVRVGNAWTAGRCGNASASG